VGENGTLLVPGFERPGQTVESWIRALVEFAGCGDGEGMTAYDLGFQLEPRINAVGSERRYAT